METEPKTDQNKRDWSKRFIDPVIRWAWNNAIVVYPANKEKGRLIGLRVFPDGTQDHYEVA